LKNEAEQALPMAGTEADEAFPVSAADEHRLDRRRFLCAAGTAAVLAIGGEWAARRASSAGEPPLEVALDGGDALAPGEARTLTSSDGREALLVRVDEQETVAFDRRCPHLGCPVLWSAERARFECPCHHAAFDARTGAVLFGPPRRGLTPATVRSA
jgi:nitrite reductase/ring-hydroxylating ferredoxin subunit